MATDFFCKVINAGIANSEQVIMELTDVAGSFSSMTFIAFPAVKREMLAIAIAAFTSGHLVWVRVEAPTANSVIESMQIVTS